VLVKTSDTSLHYILGRQRLWTRQESLAAVQKWALGGRLLGSAAPEDRTATHNQNWLTKFVERLNKQVVSAKAGFAQLASYAKEMMAKKPSNTKTRLSGDSKHVYVRVDFMPARHSPSTPSYTP